MKGLCFEFRSGGFFVITQYGVRQISLAEQRAVIKAVAPDRVRTTYHYGPCVSIDGYYYIPTDTPHGGDAYLSDLKTEANYPNGVKMLLDERNRLKSRKEWSEADKIRDFFNASGYALLDEENGTRIEKVN